MILLNVLILSVTIANASPDEYLKSQFPLYGLSEVAAKKNSKSKATCNSQLKNVYYAAKKHETWALRMLDSSGSPVNGYIWGNNYWLGAHSQCRWMSSKEPVLPFSPSSSTPLGFPPFGVDFYISLFTQNSSIQVKPNSAHEDVIHIGLCLPSVCSAEDLEPLLTLWANQNPLAVQNLYNFTMSFQKVRVLRPDFSWMYSPLIITLSLIMITAVVLTISGTIYDIYVWSPIKKRKAIERQCKINNKLSEALKTRNIRESSSLLNQDNNLNNCDDRKIDNSQHKSIPVHIAKASDSGASASEDNKQGFLSRLLLCFSATTNVKTIFETPENKDELSVVHGLQFSGMMWLIWLYSVFHLKHYADNKPAAQKFSKGFSEHIISDSTFSVDTFFFTSGFGLAFKYYKDRRGSSKADRNFSVKRKVNEFSLMALKRFMRLTPLYLVVMMVAIISVKVIRETSLFEVKEDTDDICYKYWWRNLAYVNNLYKGNEMCMSWSWYLSTDMQFFLLGVFILILSTLFWKLSLFVVVSLLVMSSLFTGYLSFGNRFLPTSESQQDLLNTLQYSPWTRVGPYLIGMFTGYLVVYLKGELITKRTTLVVCWLMGIFCSIWALFGLYSKNMSIISTAIHAALSRTAWGLSLSWIAVACSTGNAGAIKAILSYPGWIPFSKLSYSAYLLSPLIINIIISSAENAIHLDIFQMIVYFFGYLSITYVCAFFFSVTLEIPLSTLAKQAIGRKQTPNQLNLQT